ncbi:MAG: hypothetical protein IJ523_07105 [Succinivibrionaceae bacterium]|nr:hypothetical protein [Succinivibrionaceae bacterium]MBQ9611336.1 hypothetical protein [Lachnospiraceae bacterium]
MNHNNKGMLVTVILNGIIWVTGGAVAATAIKRTGNGKWGWLMMIPALSTFTYKGESTSSNT